MQSAFSTSENRLVVHSPVEFLTVRNEVAKVMFLHLSVILSMGGVCLSVCWDTTPLPPGSRHPPDQAYPPAPPRNRHPPSNRHPPGSGTPRSRDGYCCGRYASYWNAFLLKGYYYLHVPYIRSTSQCRKQLEYIDCGAPKINDFLNKYCWISHIRKITQRIISEFMFQYKVTVSTRIRAENCWIIGWVSNETNEDVRMYIEEFILVEIWIHCCTKLNWITLEKCWFIYTRNKGLRNVRIALRSQLTSESW